MFNSIVIKNMNIVSIQYCMILYRYCTLQYLYYRLQYWPSTLNRDITVYNLLNPYNKFDLCSDSINDTDDIDIVQVIHEIINNVLYL